MLSFWKSKADAESETVVEPAPAAAADLPVESPVSEPEPEAAPAAVEAIAAEAAPEAPPAPEPEAIKMPQKPTEQELEAAKEELVNEIVNKVMEIPGAVVETIQTAPYDPRFPSTNQNRHCFIRYNEFYKCAFERGSDDTRCQFYKNAYESLCPPDWVEEWEELRQNGLWFGKY